MSIQNTALVVDDNQSNRNLFCLALENVGYEVFSARNGRVALQMLEQHPVNLVVSDLSMPEMAGDEMMRVIRAQPRYNNVHIAVVTASHYKALGDVKLLADLIMYKPVDIRALCAFAERSKQDVVAS